MRSVLSRQPARAACFSGASPRPLNNPALAFTYLLPEVLALSKSRDSALLAESPSSGRPSGVILRVWLKLPKVIRPVRSQGVVEL